MLLDLVVLICVGIVSFGFEVASRGFLSRSFCCCVNLLAVIFAFDLMLKLNFLFRVGCCLGLLCFWVLLIAWETVC